MLVFLKNNPVFILYIVLFVLVILYFLSAVIIANKTINHIFMKNAKPSKFKHICRSKGLNIVKDNIRKDKIRNNNDFFTQSKTISNVSFDGLNLNAYLYDKNDSNIYVISLPGYGAEAKVAYGLQQYIFKDLGYNVLSIDHRSVGLSQGNFASFGYYEHLDLLRWINKLVEIKGKDIKIVINGTSMGGNIALLSANRIPNQVIGIIADSAYTTTHEQFEYMLRKRLHLLPLHAKITVRILNIFTKKKLKVDLYKFNSINILKTSRCPVCLITSEVDSVVSPEFSRKNYDACSSELKRLYIIPNSDHLLTCYVNKKNYAHIVKTFIDDCQKQ